MNARNPSVSIGVVFCLCILMTPEPLAYDGPIGVTFRAPFIETKKGTEAVVLERISVESMVRIDDQWSVKIDGKGRAFPGSFIATVADSIIVCTLRNDAQQRTIAHLLVPYDASSTPGTGFVRPGSISISLDGQLQEISQGPEIERGMSTVRSYRVPLEIPGKSVTTLRVETSHPLAVVPAWYQFVCTDPYLKFQDYRNLARHGCNLDLAFEPADSRLQGWKLRLGSKRISSKYEVRQERGPIKFRGQAVERITVYGEP